LLRSILRFIDKQSYSERSASAVAGLPSLSNIGSHVEFKKAVIMSRFTSISKNINKEIKLHTLTWARRGHPLMPMFFLTIPN
jgi:hypothetical protein